MGAQPGNRKSHHHQLMVGGEGPLEPRALSFDLVLLAEALFCSAFGLFKSSGSFLKRCIYFSGYIISDKLSTLQKILLVAAILDLTVFSWHPS